MIYEHIKIKYTINIFDKNNEVLNKHYLKLIKILNTY